MTNYRRTHAEGATWFFTVTLANRHGNDLLVRNIDAFRDAIKLVRARHPFKIDAMVVLPDHWHAVWTLPEGDADFATRIRLLKSHFSRSVPDVGIRNASHIARNERGIWQRRFWEHQIRDEQDLAAHIDYIHINPVKHGLSARAADWPHSSFHRYVERGDLALDWAAEPGAGVGKE